MHSLMYSINKNILSHFCPLFLHRLTQGLAESSKADKTGDERKDERDEWKIDGGIKGIKDREMVDRRREVERDGRQIEVGRNKDG